MYSIPNSPESGSEERDTTLPSVSRTTTDTPQSAPSTTTVRRRTRRVAIPTRSNHRFLGREGWYLAFSLQLPGPRFLLMANSWRLSCCFVVVALGAGVELQRGGLGGRVYVEVVGLGVGLGEGVLLFEEDPRYVVRH